jgi:hypothetical protein
MASGGRVLWRLMVRSPALTSALALGLAFASLGLTPSSSSTETLVNAPASIDANATTVTASAFSQSAYDALQSQLLTGAGVPASPAPSSAGWIAALASALGTAGMMTGGWGALEAIGGTYNGAPAATTTVE